MSNMRRKLMAPFLRGCLSATCIAASGLSYALSFRLVNLGPGVATSINDRGESAVLDPSFLTSRKVKEDGSVISLINPQGVPIDNDEVGGFAVQRFDGLPGYWSAASGPQNLSTFGGGASAIHRITQSGTVLGMGANPSGQRIAFWWVGGVGRFAIPTMVPGQNSEAYDLDANGTLVGTVEDRPAFGSPSGWTGYLESEGRTGRAVRINSNGQILGWLDTVTSTGAGRRDLVFWGSTSATPTTVEGAATPIALNMGGWILARRTGNSEPLLRVPGLGLIDIPSRTPALPTNHTIVSLADVNNRNQIVGTIMSETGSYYAARLDPIEANTEIRGNLQFERVSPPTGQEFWVQLRNLTSQEMTEFGPFTVGGSGAPYLFSTSLVGSYQVAFRSPGFLTRLSPTTLSLPAPPYFAINGELPPGDIDRDNEVGASDFSVLAASYDLVSDEAGFDFRADVDYDGEVGASDFSVLAAYYDRIGD